jgi:hypothetical protein
MKRSAVAALMGRTAFGLGCSRTTATGTPTRDAGTPVVTGSDGGASHSTDAGVAQNADAGSGPGAEPGTDPTGAPLGLVATAVAANEIDLCWRPVPGSAIQYRVYRADAVVSTTAEPCFEDKSLAAGITYGYSITALNAGGESPHSARVSATTFAADTTGDVSVGAFRTATTQQSIGMEWDLSGDTNHNATAQVLFRAVGAATWRQALPLVRVDFNGQNMLAGSILFLEPATDYDVVLSLTDPDGGAATKSLRATTRAFPSVPTDGRTFHVTPGSGRRAGRRRDAPPRGRLWRSHLLRHGR